MTDDAFCAGEDEGRRLIVEAAENAMLVINQYGTIELANVAAGCILGYAPGTLTGHPISILHCPELRAEVDALADSATFSRPSARTAGPVAMTACGAGGETLSLEAVLRILPTQRGPLLLVGLTALDHGPLALIPDVQQSGTNRAARPAPAMGESQGGRWRLDLPGRTLNWSDEMFGVFGFSPAVEPNVDAALAAFHPDDRARQLALVERALVHGTPFQNEARIIRPDGSTRTVVHGGALERGADGTPNALAGYTQDVTEQRIAQRERQRLNEFVALANQSRTIGLWECDLRTGANIWDRNMYAIYGIDDSSTPPTFAMWNATLHPHDRTRAVRKVNADIAAGTPSDTEFRIFWPNGEIRNIRSIVNVVCDAAGEPSRMIGTDWDVTEIRTLAERLREEKEALLRSEARYRALTEALPQMVWVIDIDSRLEYANQRWAEYTGLCMDGDSPPLLADFMDDADGASISAERAALSLEDVECEVRLRRFDGAYRWHLIRSVPFHDVSGDAGKWIVSATDIEERKAADKTLAATVAELEHIAHHDPMTGLPNRMLLMERLNQAMTQANRSRGGVIVLYVDLDRFKAVNDTLGHAAGDVVLKETGSRIVGTLRAGDTASRVGGDEFIVVCATSGPGDDVSHVATRLVAAINAPIKVAEQHIAVDVSIGISVYPADGFDGETLIRKADAAMYAAKQHGSNTFRRYSTEAHISIVAAAELEAELRHAVAAGEFVVHYQPIIDLRTLRPRAAEALVRWQHPLRGLLPPAEFIAFAEERGIISAIGEVVLADACAMLRRLRDRGRTDLRMGVNVSAHQFSKPGFVDSIVRALKRHDLDPGRLAIEITESVVMANTRATIATLDELQALGVHLSIDDFGTGYSSLAYIKKFPISTLKIDRSFIRDIGEDTTDQAIAKTIITLAHSLGMRVCAEGVETQEQLAILQAFDADSVQGYLFSRPLPADRFETYVETFPAIGLPAPGERDAADLAEVSAGGLESARSRSERAPAP